jgi:hypothetical protein
VKTNWPFFALTIAVPVSWHIGRTPPAAIDAFLSRSRATNRSLSLASGSSSTRRSWARWAGRRKWAMSCIAVAVRRVRASGSTRRNVPAGVSNVETPSVVTSRYGVSSGPRGSSSVGSIASAQRG